MRRVSAFTLIELLVVIAIIALLVSILVPSLSRAKDMARKAVCSTTMNSHGRSIAMYLSAYDSYPHLAPLPWMTPIMRYADGSPFDDGLNGWPKFYGVLEMADVDGTKKTSWGNWYYGGPTDQVWDGCLCPAMDAPSIWSAANNAGNYAYGGNFLYWTWFHKWAIGYQWSPYLRAATPMGRYPSKLYPDYDNDMYQWVIPRVDLRDGQDYYTQATSPDELSQPSNIAEAWDSWDLDSTPNIPWTSEHQARGAITPGWHTSVVWVATRAVLNGARHKSSPNILYADGHVAADANRPIDQEEDGLSADYAGIKAYTWSNYDGRMFGNADRLIPNCEFVGD